MNKIRTTQALAPLALVGALLFTGCSSSGTAAVAEPAAPTGTGITSISELEHTNIDTWEDEHDADFEQLVLDLNANAAPGIKEINISAWASEDVGVNVLTADDEGEMNAEQLKAVIDTISKFETTKEVGTWTISSWDQNYYQGYAEQAADDAGVKEEFIDREWSEVVFPHDQRANLLK